MLELREYQRRSLDALEAYLRKVAELRDAKLAFMHQTERPYRSVPRLPGLPYVCLRVPTGGGKTLMACHAIGIAAKEYLQAEHAVCLWLVPSNTIRDQTLAALRRSAASIPRGRRRRVRRASDCLGPDRSALRRARHPGGRNHDRRGHVGGAARRGHRRAESV